MQRGEPLPVGRRGRRGAGVEGLCPQKESPGQKGSTRWFPHGENIKSITKVQQKVDAMMFTAHYQSPLGEILLAADEVGLTGLWFDRAKYYAAGLAPQSTERETPPLTEAKRWLDVYFSGKCRIYAAAAFNRHAVPAGGLGAARGRSPMEKPQHTELWQRPSRRSGDWNECPRRPWAARWGTMKFRFWCLATGLSEPEEA